MSMAKAIEASSAGTCPRRKVGAAIYNSFGELLAVGHNGTNSECECPGREVLAGSGSAACYGIHAEVRALMSAFENGHKPSDVSVVYSTKAPCASCTATLMATACQTIVFSTASNETLNRDIWIAAGRAWIHAHQ